MQKGRFGLVVAGAALVAAVGAGSFAHAGTMGNGGKQRAQAAVNRCEAMPHDKMMADQYCRSLLKTYPEMFTGGATQPASTHP